MRKELAEKQREATKRLEQRLQEEVQGLKRRASFQLQEESAKRKRRLTTFSTQVREGNPLHADKFQKRGASAPSSEDDSPHLSGKVTVLMPRAQKHKYTLVYLHQFAQDGTGYAETAPHYFFSSSKNLGSDLKVTLPTAKAIAITAYDRMKVYAWYDYKTDFDGKKEDKFDPASLRATRDRIFRILDREVELLGGDASKVFLGGASQGCATALHCALGYPRRLGGFVGVVGHLLTPTKLPSRKKDMPIHVLNTKDDDVMGLKWVKKTYRRLKDAGYTDVHTKVVEGNHYQGYNEGQWIRRFLSKVM